MPTYTIAVCNYNMEDTVEESVMSMVSQVTEDFEVLVVDDSTDSSSEILSRLEDTHDCLRVISDAGNNNLGEARNHSYRAARGDYILSSLDTDDKYRDCIQDFVNIYHQIEEQVDFDFYLSGQGMNMAPKHLFLDTPYRSLGYGEDRDFWRRLIAKDAYIGLRHGQVANSLGYDDSRWQWFKNSVETVTVQFQSGMDLRHYLRWAVHSLRLRSYWPFGAVGIQSLRDTPICSSTSESTVSCTTR